VELPGCFIAAKDLYIGAAELAVTSIDETNQILNSDDEMGKLIKSILCEQLNRVAA